MLQQKPKKQGNSYLAKQLFFRCFHDLLHSVQFYFYFLLMRLLLFMFAARYPQNGHVLWPDGQPSAQRLQTDTVCQPADALCRSIFLHLPQSVALPFQLPFHGSPSPGQSSPSPIHTPAPFISHSSSHSSTLSDAPRSSTLI